MRRSLLELRNISKHYPGVQALDNVSVEFREGEVHALVGENGAGKSTLIKILSGAIIPNQGEILFDGQQYKGFNPTQAIELGISTIYQEFNLVPFLSVAENIFYGREVVKGPFVNKAAMNKQARELCERMGVELSPKALVKDIGVAYQQIVEIVKAVSQEARILIMDEPTAPLTERENDALFKIINTLKAQGVTIIYISHRMEEIFDLCDRVTVLRDGKFIITKDIHDTGYKELIAYMVGRKLGEDFPGSNQITDEIVLEAKHLTNHTLNDVSFRLRKGEILGFGGLVGAGRTEMARALFGADRLEKGTIYCQGKLVNIQSPFDAIRHGVGLLPEDRKQQGLLLGLSIKKNITLSILERLSPKGFVRTREETQICEKLVADMRIKTPSLDQLGKNLSGGNQQKVVLAKWLATHCDVLIFDEPTRGIDVGAKQEIYSILRQLTEKGKGIIMISSEMPELLGMSDRVAIMREGKIVQTLEKTQFCQERILEYASGYAS